MGSARVQGFACHWRDIGNWERVHVIVSFWVDESPLGYLRRGEFWFVSLSPSLTCLSQINTLTLCLLLVDLGPLLLPRPE